jgi:hypothetical protein
MNSLIDDIEQAIEFISADPSGDSEAFVSLATGKVYYRSEYMEEAEPLPSDIDDQTKYIALPHKRDLNLGVVLVFNFVEKRLPNKASEVKMMFKKRGAYSRFSNWLDRHNLIDDWHHFRNETTTKTIITWCKNHSVNISL